jgi:hypothetical protein
MNVFASSMTGAAHAMRVPAMFGPIFSAFAEAL